MNERWFEDVKSYSISQWRNYTTKVEIIVNSIITTYTTYTNTISLDNRCFSAN